ncbi:MAG TPA: ABC transporter ATP-binding protein [bacterium]|nr:ABC transporter ATP-binding protein [bacterium]
MAGTSGRGPMAGGQAIRLHDVAVVYGDRRVLDGVNLTVGQGSFVTLLGPSGCGKSTTLRVIAGFIRPAEGRVYLRGKEVTDLPPNRRQIGMVYQHYALFPHMTVFENVAFGLRVRRLPGGVIRRRVGEVLELVKLVGWERAHPRQLSGGMQQRVAVARALAIAPDILLFDEPLSALDAKLRVELRDELRALHRRLPDTTMVYVTHDQEEALALSDTVVVMNSGTVVQVGTAREVYERPRTRFCAEFLNMRNILEGERIAGADGVPRVRVGPWPVVLPHVPGTTNGRIVFGVRPDRVRAGPTAVNRLRGEVRDVVYRGGAATVRLRLAEDLPELELDLPSATVNGTTVGAAFDCSFDPADCVLLER